MKWFNRLCYLVATEICMVRGKRGPTWQSQGSQGLGGAHLGGNRKDFLSLSISKPRPGWAPFQNTRCHLACLQ